MSALITLLIVADFPFSFAFTGNVGLIVTE